MAYERLETYAAPAADTPELWRIGAVLALMLFAVIGLQQLLFVLLALIGGNDAVTAVLESSGDTPGQSLAMLFSMGLYALGLTLALRAIHWRGLASLLGPPVDAVGDFIRVTYWLLPLYIGLILLMPAEYTLIRNEAMSLSRWVVLLPVAVAAVVVQAGTEELFFRGYLTQQIRAATGPKSWAWMAVPSGLFALLHYSASSGDNAIWSVLWAFCFAIAAADLTARAGNLGPALAFHISNNLVVLLGVSMPVPGSGLALYHLPFGPDAPMLATLMPAEMLALLVSWLAARAAIHR